LDGWSSLARDPYLGVTVHWVHSTPDSPNDWSLRTLLLAFCEVKGNHSGDNLAKLVMEIINEVGLKSKECIAFFETPIQTDMNQIGWITSDNVTSNDKMMTRLEDESNTIGHEWKATDRRVRYECCVFLA
jgi:hypothetical protein